MTKKIKKFIEFIILVQLKLYFVIDKELVNYKIRLNKVNFMWKTLYKCLITLAILIKEQIQN